MKKKLLSVLLSTAMVASLLVGCGDKAEEPAPAEPETEAPAEDEEPADDEVEAPAEDESADAEDESASEWTADLSADTGSVLNIYCWNEEFKSRVTDHYPGYTDNGDGTGAIGDVKVN